MSLWGVLIIIIILAIVLFIIGMIGYYFVLEENIIDSFYITALTMAGLSLEVKPKTTDQKVFIAIFTILSVGFYLVLIAAIIACLLEPVIAQAKDGPLSYGFYGTRQYKASSGYS